MRRQPGKLSSWLSLFLLGVLLGAPNNLFATPEKTYSAVAVQDDLGHATATPNEEDLTATLQKPATLQKLAGKTSNFASLMVKLKQLKNKALGDEFNAYFLNNFDHIMQDFLPNAKFFCEQLFPLMTATQVGNAVEAVAQTLSKKSRFYLGGGKKMFITPSMLEQLLKECKVFCDHIEKLVVLPDSKMVEYQTAKNKKPNSTRLIDHWRKEFNPNPYHCMVAVRVDFLFIKMYAALLKPSPKWTDINRFKQVRGEAQRLSYLLKDSCFELQYSKAHKVAISVEGYIDDQLRAELASRGGGGYDY